MSLSSTSSSSLVTAIYTGPRAPVVLEDKYRHGRPSSSRAFLSKTPAAGSSIQVQPHPCEYQIWVKLPGFSSDGIIVTTQKERVVHIVADKWDSNGGHFERRIQFDYDADLSKDSSVMAKFRDDWLCITVRRHQSIPLHHSPCYAPIGRQS